jgi:ribosomal protein L34E
MPLSMNCSNIGCGSLMQPYLDTGDDKVYCSACNNEMQGITHFVKVQLKAMKQIKQNRPKQPKPFAVKCPKCGNEDRPKLVGSEVFCVSCNKPLDHLSESFKIMLRDKLRTTDKDV